jgi:hypothetical protein
MGRQGMAKGAAGPGLAEVFQPALRPHAGSTRPSLQLTQAG